MTTKDQLRAAQQEIAALKAALSGVPNPIPALDGGPLPATAPESKVPVKAAVLAPMPVKAKERAVLAIRQPTHFLQSRSKLPPMPKRKPFVMPGDPAK